MSTSAKKERLDVLLVERGFFETREKAKRAVMAGLVFSDSAKLDKPGMKVDIQLPLKVKDQSIKYVGRGGFKLEKALSIFKINLQDKVVVDVGCSTGGFTDCALQNGAKFVYAVDVGYGQLAWKIRSDPRVKVMERTNFRYATPEMFAEPKPQAALVDVSFISLKLIFPALFHVLEDHSDVIALVKPQFEVGKADVGKKGIVRHQHLHEQVLLRMLHMCEHNGFDVCGMTFSPITGGDGNIEFLWHARKKKLEDDQQVLVESQQTEQQELEQLWLNRVQETVKIAHEALHS